MTLLYYDDLFLQHDTANHPECAKRLENIWAHLGTTQLVQDCTRPDWKSATVEQLTRVHGPDHIESIQQFAAQGGGWIEADTLLSPRSYEVALRAAGAVCDAVEKVVSGVDTRALCLVRPPGHHARPRAPMGFCLFNNIAVGARLATKTLQVDRVLIVDWDVHHGNGTQESFWQDEQVGFLSIHRWPFYPGTGSADETGGGKGLGTVVNLPVEFGTPREEYFQMLAKSLEALADRVKPDLILVSAGFDSHRQDPIGSLGLETEDFGRLTDLVCDLAATHSQGRLVSVLEGGYNTNVLPLCVETHLQALMKER